MMDKGTNRFIENVKSTADAVKESVAEVTREGARRFGNKKEAARLNTEILRARAALSDLFLDAGREGYLLHISTSDQECTEHGEKLNEYYRQIDEKEHLIDDLARQVELLNGGSICAGCGQVCPGDFVYCPVCGTKLEAPAETAGAEENSENVEDNEE